MSNIGFDPKGFYEFDLARGAVSTRGGARVIVLSDTVVASLVSAAVETGDLTVLRELGKQIGAQVVASLGGAVFDDSPEQVLAHTSGWLGVLGWGRLGFERWGQALVAVMEGVPALDEDSLGIAALLGASSRRSPSWRSRACRWEANSWCATPPSPSPSGSGPMTAWSWAPSWIS
ncbi:MAG: hypothetical protein IPN77_01250 [Sandaracinaceae bacterium]|nr:hypothetical protein [Sandaracinaceae bacterium]